MKRSREEDSVGKPLPSNLDDLSSEPKSKARSGSVHLASRHPYGRMAGRHRRIAWEVYGAANPKHTVYREKQETLPLAR